MLGMFYASCEMHSGHYSDDESPEQSDFRRVGIEDAVCGGLVLIVFVALRHHGAVQHRQGGEFFSPALVAVFAGIAGVAAAYWVWRVYKRDMLPIDLPTAAGAALAVLAGAAVAALFGLGLAFPLSRLRI